MEEKHENESRRKEIRRVEHAIHHTLGLQFNSIYCDSICSLPSIWAAISSHFD